MGGDFSKETYDITKDTVFRSITADTLYSHKNFKSQTTVQNNQLNQNISKPPQKSNTSFLSPQKQNVLSKSISVGANNNSPNPKTMNILHNGTVKTVILKKLDSFCQYTPKKDEFIINGTSNRKVNPVSQSLVINNTMFNNLNNNHRSPSSNSTSTNNSRDSNENNKVINDQKQQVLMPKGLKINVQALGMGRNIIKSSNFFNMDLNTVEKLTKTDLTTEDIGIYLDQLDLVQPYVKQILKLILNKSKLFFPLKKTYPLEILLKITLFFYVNPENIPESEKEKIISLLVENCSVDIDKYNHTLFVKIFENLVEHFVEVIINSFLMFYFLPNIVEELNAIYIRKETINGLNMMTLHETFDREFTKLHPEFMMKKTINTFSKLILGPVEESKI